MWMWVNPGLASGDRRRLRPPPPTHDVHLDDVFSWSEREIFARDALGRLHRGGDFAPGHDEKGLLVLVLLLLLLLCISWRVSTRER